VERPLKSALRSRAHAEGSQESHGIQERTSTQRKVRIMEEFDELFAEGVDPPPIDTQTGPPKTTRRSIRSTKGIPANPPVEEASTGSARYASSKKPATKSKTKAKKTSKTKGKPSRSSTKTKASSIYRRRALEGPPALSPSVAVPKAYPAPPR